LDGIRIGVFGGTFNPVHRGHLHIAKSVQSLFGLARVYFVVAAAPPRAPYLRYADIARVNPARMKKNSTALDPVGKSGDEKPPSAISR